MVTATGLHGHDRRLPGHAQADAHVAVALGRHVNEPELEPGLGAVKDAEHHEAPARVFEAARRTSFWTP
jgi:hypothetical protein